MAEFWCGDPRDETNLEPGEVQDKVVRFGVDINILRAYIPRSKVSSYGAKPIKVINIETEHLITSEKLGDSITTEVEVPGKPENFKVNSGDTETELFLSWKEPAFDGKDDILGYKIEYQKMNLYIKL